MKKYNPINDRYPHTITITRLVVSENPFSEEEESIVLYRGVGRSYTDTTVTGSKIMDTNRRKVSIPVRFDGWKMAILDGDTISVQIGNYTEEGVVKDMEGDNDRTMIYWEYNRV